MKPGDLVILRSTGKRLTVKATNGGNSMVLCGWMEKNAQDEPVECSGAFDWQELRLPTDAEKAGHCSCSNRTEDPQIKEQLEKTGKCPGLFHRICNECGGRYAVIDEDARKKWHDAIKVAETKPAQAETQPPAPSPSDAQKGHKRKQSA